MNGQVLEGVRSFRCLGKLINSKKIVYEIKSRISAGNKCFNNLIQIFRPRTISKVIEIKIQKW